MHMRARRQLSRVRGQMCVQSAKCRDHLSAAFSINIPAATPLSSQLCRDENSLSAGHRSVAGGEDVPWRARNFLRLREVQLDLHPLIETGTTRTEEESEDGRRETEEIQTERMAPRRHLETQRTRGASAESRSRPLIIRAMRYN